MKEVKATLIKPQKPKDKNNDNNMKILGPIIMLILGIILLTNSSKAVIIVCYVIGIVFLVIGIYNLLLFYKAKKEYNYEDNNKLVFGSSTMFIGIIILLLSSAIETFLRYIIGIILIYNGVRNFVVSLKEKNYITLIIGVILIGMGLYTIFAQNILLEIIGALFIISSVIDFISLLRPKK